MNQEMFPGCCVSAFLVDASETKATDADMERECASAFRLEKGTAPTKGQLKEWNELYAEAGNIAREYCLSLCRVDTGATRSAYDHSNVDADSVDEENSTTVSPTERRMGQWRLDHIFHTPSTLQPCASWSTLEDDPESCTIGLPNKRCGSDHLPIGAVFQVLPTPRLSDEERKTFLDRLNKLTDTQRNDLHKQQTVLDAELVSIEAQVMPQDHGKSSNGNKKKKGPAPQEIIDFMRKKRSILKELKAMQREERCALVQDLGDLQRLLIEQNYGYSAYQWVDRGG
jgi:hypothetical protein